MKKGNNKLIIYIALEIGFVLLLIAIDLLTKYGMETLLRGGGFSAWEGIIAFNYVVNTGASFGLLSGAKWFLIGAPIVVSVIILLFLYINPTTDKLYRYSLLTILGGAIGNLYDRAALGYVRDFIDYKFLSTWFGIDFAIGNIADLFCIIGVLMIICYMIFGYEPGDGRKIFTPYKLVKERNE